MNGNEHKNVNFFIGFLACLYYLSRINQHGLSELIPLGKFLLGSVILSLFFSPDLDIKSSVTNRWGPLKFIWSAYTSAGHREVLHNFFWGPAILIGSLWVPLKLRNIDLWIETIEGLCLSIEAHIICDYL